MARAADALDIVTQTMDRGQELIPTLRITMEWYCYESDIYVGGYIRDPRYKAKTFEITSNDINATWLGLLAQQPKPIDDLRHACSDPRTFVANLVNIRIGDTIYPARSELVEVFATAREDALSKAPAFLEKAKAIFPYKDIVVTIDPAILDHLARKLMLQECLELDPNFSMH